MSISELILTFIFGIVASVLAWFLVAQIIRPHIKLPKKIEKSIPTISDTPFIYRIKVKNLSLIWKVYDVNIFGRVKIRGLNKDNPEAIKTFSVRIGQNGQTPYISPYRGNKDNIKSLVIKVPNNSDLLKLYCENNNIFNVKHFSIEDVFKISDKLDIELEISLICTHNFSGARKLTTRTYRKNDIEEKV